MDDRSIIELYFSRSETAISETDKKYGKYCRTIANNILHSDFDTEECVDDAYMNVWNSIPPHRPERFSAYLGRLTRNAAINRYLHNHREKRNPHLEIVLDELCDVTSGSTDDAMPTDEIVLKDAINNFLATLDTDIRVIFVRRYWYLDSVKKIARDCRYTESNVKVILYRTRIKFKSYLEKEGINL